jgi:hypothetical protein
VLKRIILSFKGQKKAYKKWGVDRLFHISLVKVPNTIFFGTGGTASHSVLKAN